MTRRVHTRAGCAWSCLAVLVGAACGDGPSGPPANAVASVVVSPGAQTLVSIGDTVTFDAAPRNSRGAAISGKTVKWASSDTDVATVDSAGLATALTNGTTTISAAIDGVVGSATLMVSQRAVAMRIGTEPAGARAGVPFETPPAVELVDANGHVATNDDSTTVTASLASGGGEITNGSTVNVAAGVAMFAELTISGLTGERELAFEAAGKAAVISEAFALAPGPASSFRIVTQPAGAAAGLPLESQPVLEILDASGNVAKQDNETVVTASIASGGGSVTAGSTVTAEAGVATFAGLAVGGKVGDRALRFEAGELVPAVSEGFTLKPGPVAAIQIDGGDGQTALADTELPEPLAVLARDAFDNAVPEVAFEWTITEGSGTLVSSEDRTNDEGIVRAAYQLGRYAGEEIVEALAAGLEDSPVAFTATATPNGRVSGTVTATAGLTPASTLAGVYDSRRVARAGGNIAGTGPAVMSPSRTPSGERTLAFGGSGNTPTPAVPATRRVRSPPGPEFVPDELIVTFRAPALRAPPLGASAYRVPATAAAVAGSMRAALASHARSGAMTVIGASPAVLAARVRVDDRNAMADVERALRSDPAVARVERNAIVYSRRRPRPVHDPHVGLSRPVRREPRAAPAGRRTGSAVGGAVPSDESYAWQAWHYHMIDLPRAWDISKGSGSVIVAVVDDGIRFDHPDIAANLTADGHDFVSDAFTIPLCGGGSISRTGDTDGYDADPTIPASRPWLDTCAGAIEDNGGHGLHVAGTIGAATDNGIGVAGVNWNVSIRPVRVLDVAGIGDIYDLAQGILYAAGLPADDGAGGTVTAPSGAPIINLSLSGSTASPLEEAAVAAATNAGSLIVAAAGNAASSVPEYPAAYPQTVSVSSVQPDGTLASYSSFGSTIDIAAPGGETAFGCGFGVISTTWNFVAGAPELNCFQGTSMAAPHVAGVAALILAAQPGLTRTELKARLLDYAVPAGDPNLYGAGIVNARNSLTQSHAPARALHARLIDAENGATVATIATALDGEYAFTELEDGEYHVYAGMDESTDGVIGTPVRPWGAAGGSATPSDVTVDGAGDYPTSFSIGLPSELEPNDGLGTANTLPVGGYTLGIIEDPGSTGDMFQIHIPSTGTYVFETAAVRGACGFALEEDTWLGLYDEQGTLIDSNEDVDAAAFDFCSRIATALQPGAYYLGVFGLNGGRYAVSARAEP